MRIQEYAAKHCADILERAQQLAAIDDLEGFPFDEIIQDEDGQPVKVVTTNSTRIPVVDILGLHRDEFAKIYPDEESLDAYDMYISSLVVYEGEDALNQIRDAIRQAQEQLAVYSTVEVDI